MRFSFCDIPLGRPVGAGVEPAATPFGDMTLAIDTGDGPYAEEGRGTISEALMGDLRPDMAPGDPVLDLGGGTIPVTGAGPYDIFRFGADMTSGL